METEPGRPERGRGPSGIRRTALKEIEEYVEHLYQETLAAAEAAAEGSLRHETFTRLVAERLTDAGEFSDGEVAYHQARGVEISGYALVDNAIHLFVTDYRGANCIESLTGSQIKQSFRRLSTFVERCIDGYADRLEESSQVFEIADLLHANWVRTEAAHLYLFSDARARQPVMPGGEVCGVPISYHVWDLERLFRFDTSGLEREPISVDIVERLGAPLPCLKGPSATDHDVFLLVMSGTFLASLYADYGTRLLERNVRSFLQTRGAINRGIRDTILKQPDRFLAFNNGISATAAAVAHAATSDGTAGISRIDDLQIVNGGQTTASLYAALDRDRADLSRVAVQVKLTVVGAETIDELVPRISRFSNTQNRVTGADFSSNDPFHVEIEGLSRSLWAPAPEGAQRQTQWFFERARGQYADALANARTPARKRQFKAMNPASQKITKTDLAKFEHSWQQLPHVVSLGAQKNFGEFMLHPVRRPSRPDAAYFERLVAKAILFRSTEKLVSAQQFGGYRANIVTYTIAKLSHATSRRLDLASIWRTQRLSDTVSEALTEVSRLVFEIISEPPERYRNVSEWCKRLDCWKHVEELDWYPSTALEAEFVDVGAVGPAATGDSYAGSLTAEESELLAQASSVEAETWFGVSKWAKETNSLQPWQRGLAYSLGKLARADRLPTVKQARQGKILLEEAKRLGFR